MVYSIAKARKVELILTHVLTGSEFYAMHNREGIEYRLEYTIYNLVKHVENVKLRAHQFLKYVVLHLKNDAILAILLDGVCEDAILQFSQEQEVNLIVIVWQRRNGLVRFLHTDIATQIMLYSKTPMLVVPTSN